MAIPPPISFTGISRFSENFQTILERAFTVANLPVKNLQTDQTVILSQQRELSALRSDLQSLQDVFSELGVLSAQGAATASSTDTSVATIQLMGTPDPLDFDIVVTSAAAAAQETTRAGLSDLDTTALAADGIYSLNLGSTTTAIDLVTAGYDNTLSGLRDYINEHSLGVQATVINTSSDINNPDYRLTLTATKTGATTLTLEDSSSNNLITSVNQGTNAVFTVNGVAAENSENTISDFAPGISLTIVGAGATTIDVEDDRGGVSQALADFSSLYNQVQARLGAHIGESAGVLSGNAIIREAQSALRQITGYRGEGSVGSIAELGLKFDEDGRLQYDSATFLTRAGSDFEGVVEFLGDTTAGFAGQGLSRTKDFADPVTGQIKTAIDFLKGSDESLQEQIDTALERIDRQIANLEAQFSAADTLLARLESQQDLLTKLFQEKSNGQ